MADFRKLLFALIAGVLLFTTVAGAANYGCQAHADPVLVRSEGIAELMGDIRLDCSGTPPAGGLLVNIRVRLTANITSNPFDSTPTLNEATLILDEGADQFVGYSNTFPAGSQNIYQATRISDDEIEWQGVTLAAVGSSAFQTIRLTNIRGNVQSRGDFATIYASVNINPSSAVPVDNNLVVVADTRPGLIFSVTPTNLRNCDPTGSGVLAATLSFKEGFSNAFRPKGPNAINSIPGGGYDNESGFVPPTLEGANGSLSSNSVIGRASYGTRLFARITNIPTGVKKVLVPAEIDTGDMLLQAVYNPTDTTTPITANGEKGSLASGSGNVEVAGGLVLYEVTEIDSTSFASVETIEIPVYITYDTPGGPLGTASVSGTLAPISTVFTMSKTAPEPRFIDKGVATTAFTINPCRTTLLFPYITNQALFDTGIEIANTSKDMFFEAITSDKDPLFKYKTTPQSGACTLHFFGNTSNGPGPADQTTPVVPAGGHLVFQLSGGGGVFAQNGGFTACAAGACIAPLFQGYMFAVCDFQFAHGFAFVSDLGSQKLAQGYLPLIIPERGNAVRSADPFSAAGAGTGEQLVQ